MKMCHLMGAGLAALALMIAPVSGAQAQSASGHDHKHDHSGHADPHGHGKVEDLGTTTVAGLKMTVGQMGEVREGGEGAFEIVLSEGQPRPKAIRVWVGNASAEGSVKTRARSEGNEYDVHVELPKKLSAACQLWVEVEPAEGRKEKTCFDLKR